ncbi:MAG: hypothetical protein IJ549_02505 [Prevotella sp.]|nr:hypothetical protein [Prevotella sp.]
MITINNLIHRIIVALLCLVGVVGATAAEKTILIGPKTIGAGWKDNIVLEARHFQTAKAGDVVTVYHDQAQGFSQGAFQDPQNWQGIAPGYGYFGISGPFRMVLTDDILNKVRERGVAIGGHDYRILYVTLTPGEEFVETTIWRGAAVQMKDDWSASAEIPGSCFKKLRKGDGIRFHANKVMPGASAKLMDFTWKPLEKATDGMPVGEDGFTYYVNDDAPLLKLQLAGTGDDAAMRVGGKGYRLTKIGLVQFVGEVDEDVSQAQRAPKEYVLQPGEVFHGEKLFPTDWSGNLRVTAEPFQESTLNDVLIISYELLPEAKAAGVQPKMSFRENKGKWYDLTGVKEPVWYDLDGNDVVLTFDDVSLDKVKTSGLVVTGMGFKLTKIELISAQ